MVSQTTLEDSLAQHIFSSFMWAIAEHIPGEVFNKRDENSISHGDLFRAADPDTLQSLKLKNGTIAGMASAIQQTGLGGSQEVYMCIIPPLSSLRKLPCEAVIEFVRRQLREHEILGHWGVVVPGYIALFRECKPFGPKHHVFHMAAAILVDIFRYVSNTRELRKSQKREDGVGELKRRKEEILQELQPGQDSPNNFMQNFVQLVSLRRRPREDWWKEFGLEVNDGIDVHGYFGHHAVFSKIMTVQSWESDFKDWGKDTNEVDIFGWTPLHYAAIRGDKGVMKKLMTMGADPNARDLVEWTPLHYVIEARSRNPEPMSEDDLELIIRNLLENGADIEIRGRDGICPIHCAASGGGLSIRVLLQAGANPEMVDNSRKTPLHFAAFAGDIRAMGELLRKGVSRGAQDDYGRIPLHLAAVAGRHEAAKALLGDGQDDRGAVDRDGRTPLHLAAIIGHRDMVNVLLGGVGSDGKAKENLDNTDNYANILDTIKHKDTKAYEPFALTILLGHDDAMQVLLDVLPGGDAQIGRGLKLAVLFARTRMVELVGVMVPRKELKEVLRIAGEMSVQARSIYSCSLLLTSAKWHASLGRR